MQTTAVLERPVGRRPLSLSLNRWAWFVIGAGIFLRLFHYVDNRSLWNDELYLVTSFVKMSFMELATSQLYYEQKAPIGFLWLVKACVVLFGQKEMALRLIPLITGVASLLLFLPVTRYFLRPMGVLLAMGLMAFSPVLVYHSVEIKQYSTEMFASVLCLYLYIRYHDRFDAKSLLLWGVGGALILWFSYSAIFFLAGIAMAVSLHYLLKREWRAMFLSIIPFTFWLLSFGLSYYLFISRQADAEWLMEWFRLRGGFLPLDASFTDVLSWIFHSLYSFLDYPLNVLWSHYKIEALQSSLLRFIIKMAAPMFLFWGLGALLFYKENKTRFLVLFLPFALTLLAAMIDKYPFYDRLLVFLAPVPILMMAKGCQRITRYLPAKVGRWRYLLPAIMLLWPVFLSARQVIDTDMFAAGKKSYYREGIMYIKEHMQEGDVVLLYWNTEHLYQYYNEVYGLGINAVQLPDVRMSATDEYDYLNKLRKAYAPAIGKKRVWFVYDPWVSMQIGDFDSKITWYRKENVMCGRILHSDFTSIGKELDSFRRIDIEVRLYDLSGQETE
ncbi:glycosyltransferase family 39 protein [Cesiribacter sp. SM1]|uniref:glycosyltransferase family 39 protein n=1 Tax=Cesiribacter sp. SM1 TaxID=2861196 RepID=UPI001CD6786C|nr:glycosyltransferase family 39 protein [Cesiribacter sp. SM1]